MKSYYKKFAYEQFAKEMENNFNNCAVWIGLRLNFHSPYC